LPTIREILTSRWKFADAPRLKPVRAALDAALDAADAVTAKHSALAKNEKLSALGRLDDVRGFVSKSTAPAVHRARAVANKTRADLATWKARLQPPAPDRGDMAAAVLRSEMRQHLRGLSTGGRMALLLAENPDPTLLQAALEAPNFSSGLTDSLRAQMLEHYAAAKHPNDLAEIGQVEDAIELLTAATETALNAAKSASEFPSDRVFEDFVNASAPVVAPADPESQSEAMRALGALAKELGIKSIGNDGIKYHADDEAA